MPAGAATQLDGTYTGTWTLVPQMPRGLSDLSFSFVASNGTLTGKKETKLYSLEWHGNYDASGKISNGLIVGWVDVDDTGHGGTGKLLRWTVRGPITGTIVRPAGSTGTVKITTTDPHNTTYTGTWTCPTFKAP